MYIITANNVIYFLIHSTIERIIIYEKTFYCQLSRFAFLNGCELKNIRHSGDETVTDDNLKRMNEINPDGSYTQVVEFLMDFHSPKNTGDTTLESNHDYTDYQWWLARTADSG